MEKESLLVKIWEEKRGRPVIEKVYPLGLLITLDEAEHSLNEIAYGILHFLEQNPENGILWALHWGRTIIQSHPQSGFGFRFTMRKDSFEKLGVMVSTRTLYDPDRFINPYLNQGRYTIVLNNQPMLYEGAVLALERMIDELVWWIYQQLLGFGMNAQAETYRRAVQQVLERGIRITAETEDYILRHKEENWSIPVRIYGKMYKEVKIPTIIGCLIDNGQECEKKITILDPVKRSYEGVFPQSNAVIQFAPDDLIVTSLTSAKPLHAGHILHFVYAEMLRRCLGIKNPLILESNDVGDRMIRTVAKLAETDKQSLESVIHGLLQGDVDCLKLYHAYRERDSACADLVAQAHHILNRNDRPLFGVAEKELLKTLEILGVSVQIVRDSECQGMFSSLFHPERDFLCRSGFQVERYKLENRSAMIPVQKRGVPTAAAMRASFLAFLAEHNPTSSQIFFVDSDASIQQGIRLAKLKGAACQTGFTQGIGISINFEVGSGTKGDLLLGSDMLNMLLSCGVKQEELFGSCAFFSLTRSLTARGHKSHPLAKGSTLGQSFHDFADIQSFERDVIASVREYREFQSHISTASSLLHSTTGEDTHESLEVRVFLAKVLSERAGRLFHKICLPSRPLSLEKDIRLYRELIGRANPQRLQKDIDRTIVSGVLTGKVSATDLSQYVRSAGYVVPVSCSKIRSKFRILFCEDLKKRGYSDAQILERTLEYLSGKWALSFRRLRPFELAHDIIRLAPSVKTQHMAAILRSELAKCVNILGV